MNKAEFKQGLRDGLPICLGYLPVSFALGIFACDLGLEIWQAILISAANLTSAGQQSGIILIATCSAVTEIGLAQLVINIRYALMSLTLTQKIDSSFSNADRLWLSFFVTDEIFGVLSSAENVTKNRYIGTVILPYIGWTVGTVLGAVMGSVVPASVTDALKFAIYGMFIAIIVPKARAEGSVLVAVLLCAAMSCGIYFSPLGQVITSGYSVIICAVLTSLVCALIFPVKEAEANG